GSSAGHSSSGDGNEALALGQPMELGLLVLLGMPALAGLANFKNFYVAGVNHLVFFNYLAPLATLLALLMVAGLAPQRVRTWPGHRPWLVWYALAWLSAAWSDSFGKDSVTYA